MTAHDIEIDAIGLLCPLPVLKLQKALASLLREQTVLLRTSDPASVLDVPHFCQTTPHKLEYQRADGAEYLFLVKKQ